MKAKIIILGRAAPEQNNAFETMLKNTFAPVLAENGGIEYFSTLKDATGAIGKAFSEADAVMFFSALPQYADTKELLCKALGLNLIVDAGLLDGGVKAASGEGQESRNFNICHAGVVSGGDIFSLSDSLYAGFAVKRGSQSVMLLPLEETRTLLLLTDLVIPYMNDKLGLMLSEKPIQYFYAEKLRASVKRENNKIAMAGTKPAEIFMKYVSFSEELSNSILFANKAENRGNMPPNEYVVNLSITAAELMGVPYGIAMSNAYYSGDDVNGVKTVYIAVTNETETTVREIRSLYGENTAAFLFRCCSEQCKLLTQVIDADAGLIKKEETPKKAEKGKGKYKALIAVITALIVLVCAFGGYYFRSHSYSLKNWAQSYLPFLSSATQEADNLDMNSEG